MLNNHVLTILALEASIFIWVIGPDCGILAVKQWFRGDSLSGFFLMLWGEDAAGVSL